MNIGEDAATASTGFSELGLPATPSATYRVSDVWTGVEIGVYPGDAVFDTPLRMHASALLQVTTM